VLAVGLDEEAGEEVEVDEDAGVELALEEPPPQLVRTSAARRQGAASEQRERDTLATVPRPPRRRP